MNKRPLPVDDSCPLHPPNLQFLVTSAQLLLGLPSLIDVSFSRLGPGPPHFCGPSPFEEDRHKAKMCWLHETFFGYSPIFHSGLAILVSLSPYSSVVPDMAQPFSPCILCPLDPALHTWLWKVMVESINGPLLMIWEDQITML